MMVAPHWLAGLLPQVRLPQDGGVHVVQLLPEQYSPLTHTSAQPFWPHWGQSEQTPLLQKSPPGHVPQLMRAPHWLAGDWPQFWPGAQAGGVHAVQVPPLQYWPLGHAGHPVVPHAGNGGQLVHTLPLQIRPLGQPPQLMVLPQLLT